MAFLRLEMQVRLEILSQISHISGLDGVGLELGCDFANYPGGFVKTPACIVGGMAVRAYQNLDIPLEYFL